MLMTNSLPQRTNARSVKTKNENSCLLVCMRCGTNKLQNKPISKMLNMNTTDFLKLDDKCTSVGVKCLLRLNNNRRITFFFLISISVLYYKQKQTTRTVELFNENM